MMQFAHLKFAHLRWVRYNCEAVFSTKSDLIEHARKDHGFNYNKNGQSTKDINCHDCEDSFSNSFHLMEHKKEKHYKKKLCSYYHGTGWGCRFENRCMNIHGEHIEPELFTDNRSRIPCRHGDQCHYYQNGSCHYKHTINMHAPSAPPYEPEEDIVLYPCSHCSYKTNTQVELKYHIETNHGACKKDYRGIVANNFPVGHAQWAMNQNMNQVEHKCNECKSVFTIESMLNAHISNIHNGNNRHNCAQCNTYFITKEDLNKHVDQSHGGGSSIQATLLKLSEKFDTFSERLHFLEQKSLTNFPNLGPRLEKK